MCLVIPTVLLLAAAVDGCIRISMQPTHWKSISQTHRIPAAAVRTIHCRTHNGQITSKGHAKLEQIDVSISGRVGGQSIADAESAHAALQFNAETSESGELELSWKWRQEPLLGWQAEVSFAIEQPSATPIHAETHNGSVRLDGLTLESTTETHNGEVSLMDCAGVVRATTHNGEIRLQGNIHKIEASTHNGGITVRLTSAGRCDGNLSTHNGSVAVVAAMESSIGVECQTANGAVNAQPPWEVTDKNQRTVEARIGSGEGKLTLTTHNGSVSLQAK